LIEVPHSVSYGHTIDLLPFFSIKGGVSIISGFPPYSPYGPLNLSILQFSVFTIDRLKTLSPVALLPWVVVSHLFLDSISHSSRFAAFPLASRFFFVTNGLVLTVRLVPFQLSPPMTSLFVSVTKVFLSFRDCPSAEFSTSR